MNTEIKNFYDLEAWQKAHALAIAVYRFTKDFPKDEMYGLTSQLRRAVSSIGANIAEGFERYHFNDKIRFYYQARGSLAEVQNFLLLVKDLEYITIETCKNWGETANEVRRLINGLIRSIENQK